MVVHGPAGKAQRPALRIPEPSCQPYEGMRPRTSGEERALCDGGLEGSLRRCRDARGVIFWLAGARDPLGRFCQLLHLVPKDHLGPCTLLHTSLVRNCNVSPWGIYAPAPVLLPALTHMWEMDA